MQQPNILAIVLDTARADVIKNIHSLSTVRSIATEGCTFTNCFANAPWTLPSHSSFFTGLRPSHHGVVSRDNVFRTKRDLVSLLDDQGYATVAFSNNPWISPDFGFDTFDDFVACWNPFQRGSDLAGISQLEGTGEQLKAIGRNLLDLDAPFTLANAFYMRFLRDRHDSGARLTNRLIRQWFDGQNSDKPFFAFVNYMEPHLEYDPPTEYAEQYLPDGIDLKTAKTLNQDPWAYLVGEEPMDEDDFAILRALYRAELAYLDKRLGELYDYLEQSDLLDETAIFIFGDHGENIGDHCLMDHQYSLYDTLLHVPLIARFPKSFNKGTKFGGLIELRDIYPTILELAGAQKPNEESIATKPLQKRLDEDNGRKYVISEYPSPQPSITILQDRYDSTNDLSKYDRQLQSIRTESWKYIRASDDNNELYNLSIDPEEENNISGDGIEMEAYLSEKLYEEIGGFDTNFQREKRKLPKANKQHLEDLGYL